MFNALRMLTASVMQLADSKEIYSHTNLATRFNLLKAKMKERGEARLGL
jgi:hypothetical protein